MREHRRAAIWSTAIGMMVAAVVAPLAFLAAWSAFFAFDSSGFMGVPAEPDPLAGLSLTAAMIGLLALPVVVARLTWRRLTRTRHRNAG